jgi:ribosomal protein S18 acetylase RimI-like enzyme
MRLEGPALEAADEANKVVHLSWIQDRTAGMHVFSDDELVVVDSGFATDTFNVVCRARLRRATSTERIRSVLRHFRSNGRPFAWWVGPADRPQDLGASLLSNGFVAAGTEPGMAADLGGLPSLASVDVSPGGLRIERARTDTQVGEFAETLAALADQVDPTVARFYERAAPALLGRDSPLWLYVGYLGKEPVATAELTVGGGIVGLYNITTRTAHRGKGIGTAMTVRPLLDARNAGFETAVLQASEEGFPIYSRLGFEVTGSFTEYQPLDARRPVVSVPI